MPRLRRSAEAPIQLGHLQSALERRKREVTASVLEEGRTGGYSTGQDFDVRAALLQILTTPDYIIAQARLQQELTVTEVKSMRLQDQSRPG